MTSPTKQLTTRTGPLVVLALLMALALSCSSTEPETGPQETSPSPTSTTQVALDPTSTAEATVAAASNEDGDFSNADTDMAACESRMALFAEIAEDLTVACDDEYLYIDADGLSADTMMVGITAWNQQVPLPQPYDGSNAWRIPLHPTPATRTTPTNGQGAVGVALNGVPIFDPTQQDGVYDVRRDPYLIGELDGCGGHSGRGDDYHYHSGPACLEERLDGDGQVIGFALDGYPILGFHESDGQDPVALDDCNGHEHGDIGYHYHVIDVAPYVLGCYYGEVDISIQPSAHPVRSAGSPIQVEITSMETLPDGSSRLEYTYQGTSRSVTWSQVSELCFSFEYVNPPTGSPGTGSEIVCRTEPRGTNR